MRCAFVLSLLVAARAAELPEDVDICASGGECDDEKLMNVELLQLRVEKSQDLSTEEAVAETTEDLSGEATAEEEDLSWELSKEELADLEGGQNGPGCAIPSEAFLLETEADMNLTGADSGLARHNVFRCMHGARALRWSSTVEAHARSWARHLQSVGHMVHGGGHHEGQNLYQTSGHVNPVSAVNAWYNEIRHTPGGRGALSSYSGSTGHYSQVVWRGTTHVGCAQSPNRKFYVCNYSPAGNVVGGNRFRDNVHARSHSESHCHR